MGILLLDIRTSIASALSVKADVAIYKMRCTAMSLYNMYPFLHGECNATVRTFKEFLGLIDNLN